MSSAMQASPSQAEPVRYQGHNPEDLLWMTGGTLGIEQTENPGTRTLCANLVTQC